jgi:hypothetical protein
MKALRRSNFAIFSLALLMTFLLVAGCAGKKSQPQESAQQEKVQVATSADAGQVRTPTVKVNAFWDDQEWTEMSKAEQDLWTFVGYPEDVWNGDEKNPPEEDMYWKQLDPEKRKVLVRMGYTKSFWDKGDPK